VQDALAAIQGWWAENGEEVIENVENTWNTIRDAIELVIEVVSTAVENGLALIKAFWAEHGESIMAVVSLAWENIKTIFNGAVAVITAVITAFQAAREGDWQAFGEQLRVIWDTIWETIATVLRNQITALGIIAKDIVNSVIGFFTGIDWSEVGKNIILGIIRGISGAKSLLQDAARDAARAAFEATTAFLGINSESSLFRNEVGVNIGVGAASGIMNSGDQIQEAMRSVFNPGNLIGAGVSPGGQPLIGAGSIPTLAANGDQQAEVGPMIKIDTVIINANDEAGGQRAADSFVRDLRDRGIMI
jgi:phage-related protein